MAIFKQSLLPMPVCSSVNLLLLLACFIQVAQGLHVTGTWSRVPRYRPREVLLTVSATSVAQNSPLFIDVRQVLIRGADTWYAEHAADAH